MSKFSIIRISVLFLFPAVLLADPSDISDSIRCDGSIIDVGDLRSKVLARCGEPTDRVDYNRYTVVHTRYVHRARGWTVPVDRYAVDFPDSASLHAHRLGQCGREQNYSKLLALFPDSSSSIADLGGRRIHRVVLDPYDSAHITGFPVSWECTITEENISEWIYNLGPTRFVRVLTFRNGLLIKIAHLDYGF